MTVANVVQATLAWLEETEDSAGKINKPPLVVARIVDEIEVGEPQDASKLLRSFRTGGK